MAAFNTNYPIFLNEEMYEGSSRSAKLCYKVEWQVNSWSKGTRVPKQAWLNIHSLRIHQHSLSSEKFIVNNLESKRWHISPSWSSVRPGLHLWELMASLLPLPSQAQNCGDHCQYFSFIYTIPFPQFQLHLLYHCFIKLNWVGVGSGVGVCLK